MSLTPSEKNQLRYQMSGEEMGCERAQLFLGVLYFVGETPKFLGIPKDISKSLDFMRFSAALGYDAAQQLLGTRFELGIGGHLQVDLKKAIELYYYASIQCSLDALNSLKNCYFNKGCNAQIPEVTRNLVFNQIKECVQKYYHAAKLGNAIGCYNLAYCYREGIIVKKNMKPENTENAAAPTV